MGGAEAGRGVEALKPEHGARSLLHFAVVLLQQVSGVPCRTMGDRGPQLEPNRAGVGPMTIRGHAERTALAEQAHGPKERASGRQVTGLTQADVEQIAFVIQRTIEVD